MRVIGVDPGNALTGFGIVDTSGGATALERASESASRAPRADARGINYVAAGAIRGAGGRGPKRLANLYGKLLEVIDEHEPAAMSLERSFVALNVQSAFTLGEARAVAMLAAAHRNLELFEYTPTDVKLTIAGYGRADKAQVQQMVRQSLRLDSSTVLSNDASDALALALCHVYRARFAMAARSAGGRR